MKHDYRRYYKYRYNGSPPRQDNKTYYTNRNYCFVKMEYPESFSLRVPSLKRGKSTWKRFYKLFPNLKYVDKVNGCKLKKI